MFLMKIQDGEVDNHFVMPDDNLGPITKILVRMLGVSNPRNNGTPRWSSPVLRNVEALIMDCGGKAVSLSVCLSVCLFVTESEFQWHLKRVD